MAVKAAAAAGRCSRELDGTVIESFEVIPLGSDVLHEFKALLAHHLSVTLNTYAQSRATAEPTAPLTQLLPTEHAPDTCHCTS
jgi:hypothetical protein